MDAGLSPARQTRAQHRHELRTLTYVTLDNTNGGVVRNVSFGGIGAQVVTAVRPRQSLRIRFELRYPRLRVETQGEIVWANFSGECGIRFVNLPPDMARKINEWIFGDLLERVSVHFDPAESMFAPNDVTPASELRTASAPKESDDGLVVSATPVKVIELHPPKKERESSQAVFMAGVGEQEAQLDWLSRPLSGDGLAWTVHTLVVVAGLLLFALVFLWITGEVPRWPLLVTVGAATSVASLYYSFFRILGGSTLGARLARLAEQAETEKQEVQDSRFR